MPGDISLLEPFDRLIRVSIDGRSLELPSSNTILRILQYLDVDLYPCRLCWNGDCENCIVTWIDATTGQEVSDKSCITELVDGMRITKLPDEAVWPEAEPDAPVGESVPEPSQAG